MVLVYRRSEGPNCQRRPAAKLKFKKQAIAARQPQKAAQSFCSALR